ncbi:hypothetical protein AUC68_01475 [Methyloceanibacter methanicus]|uniref:Uncharacterized protein n=1 Tax=Methyloceanibacter methanicus TaxID=1774968 RepID=A0A1E3W3X3_9HYPH|nr:hypothetical protein AUC68_01475 [Methyloceanibacter methanicus]
MAIHRVLGESCEGRSRREDEARDKAEKNTVHGVLHARWIDAGVQTPRGKSEYVETTSRF